MNKQTAQGLPDFLGEIGSGIIYTSHVETIPTTKVTPQAIAFASFASSAMPGPCVLGITTALAILALEAVC